MKSSMRSRPFILALFGTFLEYFDYALYGFYAPVLAQIFFPKTDPLVALLQAYGIFFLGSAAKPLGSFIFGYLGDKFGRAFNLRVSITGIAFPTLIMGLLPGYETIGCLASCILLICRIFQGLFVSGESDTARVYMYEMLSEKHPCFSNSLLYFVCMIGIYCASLVNSLPGITLGHFPSYNLEVWRICFVLGGLLGFCLFFLRKSLTENTTFLREKTSNPPLFNPLLPGSESSSFFKLTGPIFITFLLTGAVGGQYHFYFVFLNQYLNQVLQQCDLKTANYTISHLIFWFTILLPLSGLLADHLKQRFTLENLVILGTYLIMGLAILNIIYVSQGFLPKSLMICTSIGLSFLHANAFVLIFKQFTVHYRCRGISIGHSLGSLCLSGSTPFISLWLWKCTSLKTAPLYYFLFLCGLSLVACMLLNSKKHFYTHVYGNQTALSH